MGSGYAESMSKTLPPWIVPPVALLLSLGAIWGLGKVQMSGAISDHSAAVPLVESPTSDGDSDASGQPTPVPTPPNLAFPDFSGATADGHTFHLSDQKGKVVLVNYWATWCGPCKYEIPDLIALQKKYGARGFVVVGLSEDNTFAPAVAYAKASGINYTVLKTPDSLHQQIQVEGLPTSYLLNRDGKVVKAISGVNPQISPAQMWASEIEKLL